LLPFLVGWVKERDTDNLPHEVAETEQRHGEKKLVDSLDSGLLRLDGQEQWPYPQQPNTVQLVVAQDELGSVYADPVTVTKVHLFPFTFGT